MKYKLLTILLLLISATPAFSKCGNYLLCSYEIFENERRISFSDHPQLLKNIKFTVEDVNDNKFVVCVLHKKDKLDVFLSSGCEVINYGRAKSLVDTPRHAPYWDGSSIKFRDGQEGRALQHLHRDSKTFDRMEHKRGAR